MSAHTPGPWEAWAPFADKVDITHNDKRPGAASRMIARVTCRETWRNEQLANARLMAAAPELLAVAQTLLDAHDPDHDPMLAGMQLGCAVEMARAAIAKAKP